MKRNQKDGNKKPISEKTIVICGASSGIGRATALEFAGSGASVILAARRKEVLDQLAGECLAKGARAAHAIKADVTDAEQLAAVAELAIEKTGSIDVWINNAGAGAVGEYDDIPLEIHEKVVRTNLLGHMNGTYAVLPVFKLQGYGILINTISVGGWVPEPYAVAYTASKYGLRGFSESLRCELRHFPNIRICDVFPAYIDTPGFQHAANYIGKVLKPIPPVFPPERVAQAMLSLAVRPRSAVSVGETAPLFRFMNFISPSLMRNLNAGIMENYFRRAQSAHITTGAILEPMNEGTGVSGGWIKPKKKPAAAFAIAAVLGLAGGLLLARKM